MLQFERNHPANAGFVCFVLTFPKQKRHALKNDAYASNFQSVNSDLAPFRGKKRIMYFVMYLFAFWARPVLEMSRVAEQHCQQLTQKYRRKLSQFLCTAHRSHSAEGRSSGAAAVDGRVLKSLKKHYTFSSIHAVCQENIHLAKHTNHPAVARSLYLVFSERCE